ncbi:unnamed protein product [Diabrotica balteata]|uniref:Uncharacterized protein n=1 Tax=Diabrotica balteata TaxID=107213 RepID=A0A9N9XDW9_DIABA|nr:unnamed protein product [Diabrotica balteata]
MKQKSNVSPHIVFCQVCKSDFDISNSGRSNIKQHLSKKKHVLATNANSKSIKLETFGKKENNLSSENMLIAAKEGTFAYHKIKHLQSFRSLDCTSKLIVSMFEPKFAVDRTKTETIVKNVLAQEAQSQLEIDFRKANFVSITIDSSNHREINVVSLIVRYFDGENGVQLKLFQLRDLPGETSEQLKDYVVNVLNHHNLLQKFIRMSDENTNTNFGGMRKKGVNNLFSKLNASREVADIVRNPTNSNVYEQLKSRLLDKYGISPDENIHRLKKPTQLLHRMLPLVMNSISYRRKLSVHNLTMFDLRTNEGFCYFVNETEGELEANEFASVLTHFVESQLPKGNKATKIVIFSDVCNYQNRSVVMSHVAVKHKISIEKLMCQQTTLTHAKMQGKSRPYKVTYLDHLFFKYFTKSLVFKSIRPGTRKGDSKVTYIRCLKYDTNGKIRYKLSFNDDFKLLPSCDYNRLMMDPKNPKEKPKIQINL